MDTSRINLPDLFRLEDGQPVKTAAVWQHRREELRDLLLKIEYGPLPEIPSAVVGEELHSHTVANLEDSRHVVYRVTIGGKPGAQFLLDLLIPPGDGPIPVVLNGDACWRYLPDEISLAVLKRGNILAQFNRTELMADTVKPDRWGVVRHLHPKQEFGALAAWAWGYHRCVDFLQTLPVVDAARIAIAGHSRGGKAALLAGATDQRIALTTANGSGCGGAACFRAPGPKGETLADILRGFPYWFSPRLREYITRESALPFDQHSLAAMIAPRALLFTEALQDLWANPSGAFVTFTAAKKAFVFLNAADKIGIRFRTGGHEHNLADWTAFLDFFDWQLKGRAPVDRFDVDPFTESPVT